MCIPRFLFERSCIAAALAFDQVTTLPVVWITAHCCMRESRLCSMQYVLVHAASGGVGLTCVEWVGFARATIHATAGGISKHALLRSSQVMHLSSSRNAAACASLVSCHLRGRRLHSVVSALSNDFVPLSLASLQQEGTFSEIGKNLIWSHDRSLASHPLADYLAVAVDDGCRNCPGWNRDPWWFNSKLRQLFARVRSGEAQPLLFEAVAFEERAVQAALRLLQRGANLGKVVVRVAMRETMAEEEEASSIETVNNRGATFGTLVRLGISTERGVAVFELHDPQRFNTMGWALGDDMRRAVDFLRQRDHCVSATCLQAAGSTFCAGGNPYGSGGPTSLAASSRYLLESVRVCVCMTAALRACFFSLCHLISMCFSGLCWFA